MKSEAVIEAVASATKCEDIEMTVVDDGSADELTPEKLINCAY
jgi:glycosyltransferase involved in cell wall biosynthesis